MQVARQEAERAAEAERARLEANIRRIRAMGQVPPRARPVFDPTTTGDTPFMHDMSLAEVRPRCGAKWGCGATVGWGAT